MALDKLRKLLEEATGRVGEAVDEYEQTTSPSAGSLRSTFGLSSADTKTASPEMDAFFARMNAVRDRRDAEAASRLPPVKAREDMPREGVPSALRPSNWVTARPASLGPSQPKTNGEPVGSLGVVPVPPPEPNLAPQLGPFYRSVDESTLPPVGIRLPVEAGPMMTAPSAPSAPVVSRDTAPAVKTPEAQPIPVANAPSGSDAAAPVTSALPATTETQPAGKPNSDGAPNLPAPSSEGAGGDASERDLYLARLAAQNAAGFGGMGAGKNIDMGIADTLGERMKQIEALRAKKVERQEGLDLERSQNEQTLNAYQAQFPELRETLEPLRGQTGKPVFPSLLRDIVATRKTKTGERALDLREQGMQDTAAYRAGTLGLRKDTLKETQRYNDIQAGLKQAELNLRAAEGERKATGSAEPSEKERSAFQTSMKPAEQTAVSLRDADTLNSLGEGMLVTGKPPAFLSRSDIAAFNGVPFGQMSRSRLAQSNPQAYDLLTKMAEIKTIIGHEYFGSALSPAEAERQRQFMDFSALDTPESIAKKMKNYQETLANKATVFLRPRVVGRPLGTEWAQATGLDALSAPGGTFAGLLEVPKSATPKTVAAPAGAGSEGKVRMLSPDNRVARIPAAEVEARKAQGWKEAP